MPKLNNAHILTSTQADSMTPHSSMTAADLPVRKLAIDLSTGFRRHWHGGDAYRSMYFNALSMSFPVGEQFFIDSVRAGLHTLPASHPAHASLNELSAQFIGQEATHRHLHGLYNRHLDEQGLRNHWQRWAQRRVNWCAKLGLSPLNQLAVTSAYEHCTAVFADACLRSRWLDGADEPMQTLWYWHASEETEHKAVAFDLYRALGGGTVRRIAWYVYIFTIFSVESTLQTLINLKRDGSLFSLQTWTSAFRFWLGRNGQLHRCLPPFIDYLRPAFHPDDDDNRALAQDWLTNHSDRWTRVK